MLCCLLLYYRFKFLKNIHSSFERLVTARIKRSEDRFSLALESVAVLVHQTGGARRDRTADLLRARQALSQLSYSPSV